jgi:radical SAM protein with 4Fe4S-binding SPASM domain
MNRVTNYIKENAKGQDNSVVFFGGEPLLEYLMIDKFIKETDGLYLSYILYTNGLLIDRVPLPFYESINNIIVSLDGDKKSHEKHRGKGTYDKIINNLKLIKPKVDSFFIGRITSEEETNIYESVTNILSYVDAIYWQIVNKPKFNDSEKFINNYKNNLGRLFDFWLYHFKQGQLFNIIPFQAIISSLLFNYGNDGLSFRCHAGSSLQVIGGDGNIYWCDEYIGEKKGIIGNIYGNKPIMEYESHEEIFADCKKCNITSICLGRCKKCLKEYPIDVIRVYCTLTKYLVEIIINHIDEIKMIIDNNNYNLKSFYNVPYCTEEIP